MSSITNIRVFIASPGGLAEERAAFKKAVDDYTAAECKKRNVTFEPVAWEVLLPGRKRPQERINEELRSCHYFIMILQDRWGTPPSNDPDHPYSSGSEEEWHEAPKCLESDEHPMREVVLYFKSVAQKQPADAGPQLEQVLNFRRRIEKNRNDFYGTFDTTDEFAANVRRHLSDWLLEKELGVTLPLHPPRVSESNRVKPEQESLGDSSEILKDAWEAADGGRLVDAETLFAKATIGVADPDAIHSYGRFLLRLGHLDRAEEIYQKSIAINEALGRKEGMARTYGDLGCIYHTQGDLDRAGEMLQKSLAIYEELGRKKGMASDYCNLGILYYTRGDLDHAEEMCLKSLAINEELGRKEGIASDYGSLGTLNTTRGDLDRAEKMHKKVLTINEELGGKEGMAAAYGNLGNIYQARGDLDQARIAWQRSLSFCREVGAEAMIEKVQGWLDAMPKEWLSMNTGDLTDFDFDADFLDFRDLGPNVDSNGCLAIQQMG